MEQHIETLSPLLRNVVVTVPASEVNAALDKAAYALTTSQTQDSSPRASVSDADQIESHARASLVDTAISLLLRTSGFMPVNRILCEDGTLARGETFSCTLHCEVLPDIVLPNSCEELHVAVEEPLVEPNVFHAALHSLRRSHCSLEAEPLPELDDAFAASTGFGTLKNLHTQVFKKLLNRTIALHQREAEEKLLTALVDPLDFPLPESLILVHHRAALLQERAFYEQHGLNGEALNQKLSASQSEREEAARQRAKRQAFLMALGYREHLVVTEQDVTQEIQILARQSQQEAQDLHTAMYQSGAVYELQDQILADKALRWLYGKVKKTVVDSHGVPVPAHGPSK